MARIIKEKAATLKDRFYLQVKADLLDITKTTFVDETFENALDLLDEVIVVEICSLLRTRRTGKALGDDSILNEFLKAIGPLLIAIIVTLATAY